MIECSACEGTGDRYRADGRVEGVCLPCDGTGEAVAGDDPRHVEWLLDHLAHLTDAQVEAVRVELTRWHETARDTAIAERILASEPGGPQQP